MTMTHKIVPCLFNDDKGIRRRGIYMLNRRTNTFVVLDKHFNHVKITDKSNLCTLADSEGCMYCNLDRH